MFPHVPYGCTSALASCVSAWRHSAVLLQPTRCRPLHAGRSHVSERWLASFCDLCALLAMARYVARPCLPDRWMSDSIRSTCEPRKLYVPCCFCGVTVHCRKCIFSGPCNTLAAVAFHMLVFRHSRACCAHQTPLRGNPTPTTWWAPKQQLVARRPTSESNPSGPCRGTLTAGPKPMRGPDQQMAPNVSSGLPVRFRRRPCP